MEKRKLSSPFLVQMSSGEANQQCDIFPHGSFREVQKDDDGYLWLTKGVKSIPVNYKTRIISEKPEVKICPSCKNEFPVDWMFSEWRINGVTQTSCVRCYERKYIIHNHGYSRDDYRQTLREELKRELGISSILIPLPLEKSKINEGINQTVTDLNKPLGLTTPNIYKQP